MTHFYLRPALTIRELRVVVMGMHQVHIAVKLDPVMEIS
jgi:hypothetical protein